MSNPASGTTADLLCPDCGHHLHRPSPGACEWYDCGCPATEPRLDDEGPLHHHSDAAGTAVPCRTLHRPSNPASGTNEARPKEPKWPDGVAAIGDHRTIAAVMARENHAYLLGRYEAATERAIGTALDVERLRRAIDRIRDRGLSTSLDAVELAAEYARLASETPRPGEPTDG